MNSNIRRIARDAMNSILGIVGLELVRSDRNFQNYIDFQKTIAGAKNAGLSVGDYIDRTFNIPGATQMTIARMAHLGVFSKQVENVCEIGPGSGRYLERTIAICHPRRYEIYETAETWRTWLEGKYSVIAHKADGKTLSLTESCSIHLVHAHKVFPGLRTLSIFGYFDEMMRVAAPNSYIVFDVLTEECFSLNMLPRWMNSSVDWPCAMIPKKTIVRFFTEHEFSLLGDFVMPSGVGVTEYFVFRHYPN